MKQQIKNWLCVGLFALLFLWLIPTPAHAQSIDYAALKYGTKQTSMASGYFVHPATVTVRNHAYVVTMDIKTAKKLTNWPVKVLSVDGQAPTNVRKEKDSAGNSHLYYSFTTTNLKRAVTAKLAINVPDVYRAKHLITFKFQTAHLPALTQAKTATTAKKVPAVKTSKKTNTSTASSTSAVKPTKSVHHQSKSKEQPTTSSSSSSHQPSAKTLANQQSATNADRVPQQSTHWGRLIAGIVAILVVVGGGSWWYVGRH